MALDWVSCSPRLVRREVAHIKAPLKLLEWTKGQNGIMTPSLWGLLCYFTILIPGTLGTYSEFGSQRRQIHSIRPSVTRVSPQVPPRVHERFRDVESTERTSDEEPSTETYQEVQLGEHDARGAQGARRGDYGSLTQERRRTDSGGELVNVHINYSQP